MHEDGTFPQDWIAVVITFAVIGGIVGLGIGLGLTLLQQGLAFNDPDPTIFIIDNTRVLSWAVVGGGLGWCIGTILGWRVEPKSPPRNAARRALRIVALGIMVAGVITLRAIPSGETAHVADTNLRYDVTVLTWSVLVDVSLAVSTLLVLSRRRRTSTWPLRIGCLVVLTALLSAVLRAGSLPLPEQAWLQQWLATRQASLGAAPNLIVPTSAQCQPRAPDPYPGDDRSFRNDVPPVYYWINPFAPRWLPEGFGLDLERSWPSPQPHAVWTDADCRQVTLLVKRSREEVLRLAGVPPDVADWRLVTPTWCPDEPSDCREYHVGATTRGSHVTMLLILRTVGLSLNEADRIARSIPTDRAAYI